MGISGGSAWLIFYTEKPDEIAILRVIHSSRDYPQFFGDEK